MKKITIIAKPAMPYMVSEFPFLNYGILERCSRAAASGVMRYQIIHGHALMIEAHVFEGYQHEIFSLALAGLLKSKEDEKLAQVWFSPTIDMPQFAKSLLVALPRLIKGMMLVGGFTVARTMILPREVKFKKFAKLCKFNYSSSLKFRNIQFEEWEFGDYHG